MSTYTSRTTTTTTTTTDSDSGLIDPLYLKGIPGIMKFLECVSMTNFEMS